MRIIDAQIHDIGPYWDWLGERDELQHRIMGEVMIAYLDALGVSSVVLFPGGHDPHADWLSRELPDRFTYVPHVAPGQWPPPRLPAKYRDPQQSGLVREVVANKTNIIELDLD